MSSYSRAVLNKSRQLLQTRVPFLQRLSKQLRAKTWDQGSIVYYTGNRKNGLTPHSLETGASGTESAVIYLAREWAKAGRQVTVYSTCGDYDGTYDGVDYINYYHFNPYDTFDTLIILSHPYLLPTSIKARNVCWDWHDVLGNEKVYPLQKIAEFDRIFAKSSFQRSLLPNIDRQRFTVVTNGIDPTFEPLYTAPKNPYKLIYASRYYRGLDLMLRYGWPVVKQQIPDAELHIYHGWSKRERHPKYDQWRQEMTALFQQEGVVEHGKVSQAYLMSEKSTASIHYYACTYPEIDCISVRESAFVGCVPVTTDFAVFREKRYCDRVPGDPTEKTTQIAIAHRIIQLLKNPQELETLRQQFREAVRHETWENVSKIWLEALDME